jgi:GT2 family glycosyltransferase
MNSTEVSIVVVNWNTRDMLRDCLHSIYDQTKNLDFEVIVIDNASVDRSKDMVKSEYSTVILIENNRNRGFAAANNQGMAIAKGQYILLLNPDTIVLDRAIQTTIEYADQHPDVGVVGCQVWKNEYDVQMTCFPFPSATTMLIQFLGLRRMFPRSRLFGWIDYGGWERNTEREVDVVSGMYMLIRKDAIRNVGLMDEDYFVYSEESDWCYRFWKAGWRCVFIPNASIIHRDGGNKSTDLVKAKMYIQMQKSILIFHKKHLGKMSWLAAKSLYVIAMVLSSIMYKLLSLLRAGRVSSEKAALSYAALKYHLLGIEPK